jgi:hypothetical protein
MWRHPSVRLMQTLPTFMQRDHISARSSPRSASRLTHGRSEAYGENRGMRDAATTSKCVSLNLEANHEGCHGGAKNDFW